MKLNVEGDVLLVCLYIDDLIFTSNSSSMINKFKKVMAQEFEMTDIRLMTYYLGIAMKKEEDDIFISQEGYANEVLKKFNMSDCKLMCTVVKCGVKLLKHKDGEKMDPTLFKSLVGSLQYLTLLEFSHN